MNDLFDAIKMSIRKYVEIDSLNVREQAKLRSIYDKYVYNSDAIDSILNLKVGEDSTSEEEKG